MKRTIQTRRGNVTGTRKPHKTPASSIPRNEPYPRQVRRMIRSMRTTKANLPKWAVTSNLLDWMFYRAGVYAVEPPKVTV